MKRRYMYYKVTLMLRVKNDFAFSCSIDFL